MTHNPRIGDSEMAATCQTSEQFVLPQPRCISPQHQTYQYILYEDLEKTLFDGNLSPSTLCWVLKSKGRQAVQQRAELFLRARVVSDEESTEDKERRVLVRYPKGSTYRVKRSMLLPVLELNAVRKHFVLVMAETSDYRRAAVVHTCIGDSLLEIGCDFGPTVDRVQHALQDNTSVPVSTDDSPVSLPEPEKGKWWCIGIDKSPKSIEIAKERFPDCRFSVQDVLTATGVRQLRQLCRDELMLQCPSVVAIDINGNREIPAVLQCLDNVMNCKDEDESWELPRLVLVKSRHVHHAIQDGRIRS